MVIAALVFLPIIISPFFYILGLRNEDLRDNCAIGLTFFELALSLLLAHRVIITGGASLDIPGIFWGGLHFDVDGFRSIYSIITSVMWAGTTLFAREYFRREREGLARYWLFVILTLGATQGVMLSADLMTTFVFFEIHGSFTRRRRARYALPIHISLLRSSAVSFFLWASFSCRRLSALCTLRI